MKTFSYTLSPKLQATLSQIDQRRKTLLLMPIKPAFGLRLRWAATLERVYYSLLLSNFQVTPKQVSKTLTSSLLKKPKKFSTEQKMVLKYKKALDLISMNWLSENKTLDYKIVKRFHEIGANGTYKKKDAELKQILDYIQTGEDHPVVQAAIIYAGLEQLHGFSDGNRRIARVMSLIFLFKSGYDLRGFVSIEKEWFENRVEFEEALRQGIHAAHMTVWIEYFALSLLNQLDSKLEQIQNSNSDKPKEKRFAVLNDRQKEILMLLEEPNISITNKKVQKMFDISQITASRDLTKMATLGLLVPHGHGRSVYYTRI